MFNILKIYIILTVLVALTPWRGSVLSAQELNVPAKRVLAIFDFKQGLPWAFAVEKGMRKALKETSGVSIELNVENADQARFPEKEYQAKLLDLYRYKYSNRNIDLVMAVGDEATELVMENGTSLFGKIPTILFPTYQKKIARDLLEENMVVQECGFDFLETAQVARKLLPQTRQLYVISGTSTIDRRIRFLAAPALEPLANRLDILFLDGIRKEDLLLQVEQLPEKSAILYLSVFRDGAGRAFVPREVLQQVSEHANAPVFGIVDTYLGSGIVGGALLSADAQGRKCIDLARKILKGDPVEEHRYSGKSNELLFDWRQLKRWSIREDRLPKDSVVRYRPPSIWRDHQGEIFGGIAIIVTQTLALIFIVIQTRRRNLAEADAQRLRDERSRVARVLALGEISASLAHELNQPLSAIRTYAQAALRFLNNDPPQPGETARSLEGIVTADRRVQDVIKKIRHTLQDENIQQKRVDAKEMLQEVILVVKNTAREAHVTIRLESAADLPPVAGDRILLQQVVLNLTSNGIEAIADSGRKNGELVLRALQEQADTVTVCVRDNGTGIDPTVGDRLFDPFYTTKPNGMGMGLPICRSIIENHGGRVWLTANPLQGAIFSFTVPIYKNTEQ